MDNETTGFDKPMDIVLREVSKAEASSREPLSTLELTGKEVFTLKAILRQYLTEMNMLQVRYADRKKVNNQVYAMVCDILQRLD